MVPSNSPEMTLKTPGFRLKYLQVYNWGLYNNDVATIIPEENSALLIGANASGKSTLVDSILTLFLSKPKFNLAGDANKKNDRDLVSYVRGAYSNRTKSNGNIEPVYLREKNEFSVILAAFISEGKETQHITLAQFFWFDTNEATAPKRLYIVSHNRNLDLLEDFKINTISSDKDFKSNLKRIGIVSENDSKNADKIGIQTDKFSVYSNKFSELFGFRNKERALNLFNQTVSLKNVGDLTAFIRSEMLDEINIEPEIVKLKETFDAANRIANKIKEAERKLEILKPLSENGLKYNLLEAEKSKIEGCIDVLPSFYGSIRKELLEREKTESEINLNKANASYKINFSEGTGLLDIAKADLDVVKEQISLKENEMGVDRIKDDLRNSIIDLNKIKDRFSDYRSLINNLNLMLPVDETQFQTNIESVTALNIKNASDLNVLETENEAIVKKVGIYEIHKDELAKKLDLLQSSRGTLLDVSFIEARKAISENLNISIQELPFVCELLQVKDSEREWQGSLEKLLKPFGLNLVIQNNLYREAGRFIGDFTFNDVKINFFKLPENIPHINIPGNKNVVFHKLDFKPETKKNIRDGLLNQIINQFDYLCCEKEELFKVKRAITKKGFIKRSESFHEKDDRKGSNNPANYILGWDNTQKKKALKEELDEIVLLIKGVEKHKKELKDKIDKLRISQDHIKDILKIKSFKEIDSKPVESKIAELETEIENLKDNGILAGFYSSKKELERKIKIFEYLKLRTAKRQQSLSDKIKASAEEIKDCDEVIITSNDEEKQIYFPLVKEFYFEDTHSSEEVMTIQKNMMNKLTATLKLTNKDIIPLGQAITASMQSFCTEFREEAKVNDLGTEIQYLKEYIELHDKIQNENLPQYKEDFDIKIREQTDTKMTDFRRAIFDEKNIIEDKIEVINQTLKKRHYEKDRTFIQIIPRENEDDEIDNFRNELKACFYPVGKQLTKEEKDIENLRVFNNIKHLLDKLDLLNVPDKGRWAKKVTDVRNWFIFSASERNIHNPEKEVKAHSGTAGQSGGETSKITYTILASAITYQFGLDQETTKTNSLRFVAIDEIFNNLGEVFCHYVLQMFQDMNLQLLIVSPDSLEKVHIAEKYVKNVHWTYKRTLEEKDKSFVINITKQEMMQKLKPGAKDN